MPSVQMLPAKPKVVQTRGCDGLRQGVSDLKSSRVVKDDIDRALPDIISNTVKISDGLRQVVSDLKSSRITEEDIDRALPESVSNTGIQTTTGSDVELESNDIVSNALELDNTVLGVCDGAEDDGGDVLEKVTPSLSAYSNKLSEQLRSVVRGSVRRVKLPYAVVVVASQWPCWLIPVLSLRLPLAGAFFPRHLHSLFKAPTRWSAPKLMSSWATYEDFLTTRLPDVPLIILASGQGGKLSEVLARVKNHKGVFMFAMQTPFLKSKPKDTRRFWYKMRKLVASHDVQGSTVVHADYGGATSAGHQVFHRNVPSHGFQPSACVPRVLKHLLNSASRGRFEVIEAPPPIDGDVAHAPLVVDQLLRQEGLLDMYHRMRFVACPSVFAKTKWVKRMLTSYELLRAFDMPITMDAKLLPKCSGAVLPFGIEDSLSPLVITSILSRVWGVTGGSCGAGTRVSVANVIDATAPQVDSVQDSKLEHELGRIGRGLEVESEMSTLSEPGVENFVNSDSGDDIVGPPRTVVVDLTKQEESDSIDSNAPGQDITATPSQDRIDQMKLQHDLAKAVKSDNAEVPIHLWDAKICRGPVSSKQANSLNVLRSFFLRIYRKRLWRDCRRLLCKNHGKRWCKLRRQGNSKLRSDLDAMRDILWRTSLNSWFEYPGGSRLLYWRFPTKYQRQAKDGVPIYFIEDGPTSMRAQMNMSPEETAVLREKILKVIQKRYLVVPDEKLKSVISYFGVPKGVIDGIIQDWRIVYHAGANGLNDKVWAPSFWLPGVNSLIRMLDLTSVMEDRDIGEMFLNFELHPMVRKFAGVDVGPLGFTKEECASRWLCWVKNLMGFKPSPYNSIKMNLIAEEVIRGDRHDLSNAFQWKEVILNLPGTETYNPGKAWIAKVREDGTLASDFATFVDDQRLAASGSERMDEAGHALSSREAYLGIQDALRKLRAAGGTFYPGAWAGVVVFNDEKLGLVVLTSQEKWDRLKSICSKWLMRLEASELDLDHTELRSDKGFMVHVTQAYPSMKPYMKGFHLSMETWRGGRDAEGWKLPDKGWDPHQLESVVEDEMEEESVAYISKAIKDNVDAAVVPSGPESGITRAVPRFAPDLKALLKLADGDKPALRIVRSKVVFTAYYGFGDASSGGFGATVERADGVHGRFGLWGKDADDKSSNYRELRNLVETVEEEASEGHLSNVELWLFTDNSTAESCYYKGSSTSPLLHELILRLRKVEIDIGFRLYMVHVSGTRMIAQGTDGLSRGMLLEGVLTGKSMLGYIDLAKGSIERYPPLLDFVRSWSERPNLEVLTAEQWFVEAHGIIGGKRDHHGVWIPDHASNGQFYLWAPPPVVADVCLEECLKAVHKRRDAFHVFMLPRLFTPAWTRLFHKLCDFVAVIPVGSTHWPTDMHEPLWIGFSLPFIRHHPWALRGTPLLVDLGRQLREVLSSGEKDGGDILRKLLRTSRRITGLSKRVARGMLRMPGEGTVPNEGARGLSGQPVVQTGSA